MNTPRRRPRMLSGTAVCSMVCRKIELTLSAAPAPARATEAAITSGRFGTDASCSTSAATSSTAPNATMKPP
ncbi:hypothetical protein [Rathayibacter oskolensis]|uniref:hypothetical protein n=1 Tax=Rathayibacter oskolensis TaxID=1891671 RepID=UPI0034659E79